LIAMLDDKYNVQIENDEFESLHTIDDILNVIQSKSKSN